MRAARLDCLARDGPALTLFTALALLAVHPVLTAPGATILGWPGDNVQFVYVTGWIAEALGRGRSPFVDPQLNYPGALAMTATDVPFAEMIAAAPLTWLFGPVLAYNAIIVICHILAGYVPYLWIHRLTGSRAAGTIAGIALLLSPFRVHHSYGHLMLVATFVVPLFFWTLDAALRRDGSRRRFVALAAATALVGGTSQYVLVICLITGAAYGIFVLLGRDRARPPTAVAVVACVIVGAGVGASPYLATLSERVYAPYDVATTRIWSAEPARFFTPSPLHPLWGDGPDSELAPLWIEKTVYVGIVPALLAIVGLARATPGARRFVWLATALTGAVLALGTDLHVDGKPLSDANPLYLPAYYVARLPLLDLVRVWARFGIIPITFVALMAGLGTATLVRRWPRWHGPLMTAIALLVIVELLPGALASSRLEPRPIDRWLATQPGEFAVAFLPSSDDVLNYRNMFGSLVHGKRLPAHNHPVHQPPEFADFARRAAAFPDPRSVDALRAMGLRYLLVQRSSFDGVGAPSWTMIVEQLAATPGVTLGDEVEGFLVVQLD